MKMNRKIIVLTAAVLSFVMLFSSCKEEGTDETTDVDIITEGTPEQGSNENNEAEQTSEAEETTTEEPATEKEDEPVIIGTVVGYTSKGFVISKKNGITYVDGVLVANKTYALPESYNPGALLSECERAFSEMKSAAAKEGLTLWNASGFRSYELQQSLYNRYCDRDGKAAADRYSARPGHSEHQSGLALDLNEISSSFANTAEGKWVEKNCHKYGFILRYPRDKEAQTGYMYEPWHIRYVGVSVAEKIYNSGLCLEEYFGITSVYAPEEETTVLYEETTAVPEALPEETTAVPVIEETTEVIITD
ncbi:MAG: D-alanyl-D-alanine carboxypeptidase family protein [Ruminococcaceae bacterium]|nr:D-alanyl-D-alanine carboxypeptidase family protein [Oscillospiraceae bacterium]